MSQTYTPSVPGRADYDDTVVMRKAMGYVRAIPDRVAIWPIVLVIYATLLPREISIRVGTNYIYLDRLALLCTVPWISYHVWRGVTRFVLPDWLVLLCGTWMIVSFWVVYGPERAIVSGASFAFDMMAGYYLARISFRSLDDMRRALIVCAPGFLMAGLTLVVESISHHILVRPFFGNLLGTLNYAAGTENTGGEFQHTIRFGLLRAYGPWIHPIMAGLHMSTLLAVYWKSGIRGWPLWVAMIAVSTAIFTVSSAAILTLVITSGALFYDWLCSKVRGLNWPMMITAVISGTVVLSMFTKAGLISLIIRFATLDPATSYYRIAIWTYGVLSVWAHPWFGIGFESYRRPEWMLTASVDTHWLLYAMRFGMPAAASLFLACLFAMGGLLRAERFANARDSGFYRGILISLLTLVVMGFSVSYQGGTLNWFSILLGASVACAQHTYVIDWAFWIRRKPHVATPAG